MAFTVEFDTANAAFGDSMATEIARILTDVAEKVSEGRFSGPIKDINGNRIGEWSAS